MTKIEVGQVWKIGARLVMVCSEPSAKQVRVGSAVKRGSSYAVGETPEPMSVATLRRGTFVFDTEGGDRKR
jgi:hypothetical protein